MQNRQILVGSIIVAAIVIGAAWYATRQPHVTVVDTTQPTTTQGASTSTAQAAQPKPTKPATPTPAAQYAVVTLPIDAKDKVPVWSFKGAYVGNATLEQKAHAEITRLTGLLSNTSDVTVQETYISIGNQYELLGDGKSAYDNFLKALNTKDRYEQEDALAWANLGDLMTTLGALHTAETAYASATHALPGEASLYVSRISFLLAHMPTNTTDIDAAFAEAAKYVPGDASVAQLQAQYQKSKAQ